MRNPPSIIAANEWLAANRFRRFVFYREELFQYDRTAGFWRRRERGWLERELADWFTATGMARSMRQLTETADAVQAKVFLEGTADLPCRIVGDRTEAADRERRGRGRGSAVQSDKTETVGWTTGNHTKKE